MIIIKIIPNRFENKQREIHKKEYVKGALLSEYIKEFDLTGQAVYLNTKKVEDFNIMVKDNSYISIIAEIHGDPISAFLTFLVIVASCAIVIAAIASIPYSIYAAITSKPRKANRGLSVTGGIEDGSPTYGWTGVQITSEPGIPIGVVLGKHRVGGNIINQYVSVEDDKNYLNVLIALGEGELDYIDDIEINGNPSANYTDIKLIKRYGTADQEVIPYFDQIHRLTDIGVEIKQHNSYTYTTTLSDIQAFEIYFQCPQGLFLYNMYNELQSMWIDYQVEYKLNTSSDWINLGEFRIEEKTRSVVRRVFRKDGIAPGKYDIRVTKLSMDSVLEAEDGWKPTTDFYIQAFDEITDQSLSYPNVALLGIRILATEQLSGSVPNITSIVKKKVLQPQIMNGTTEVDWADYYYDPDYDSSAGAYRLLEDDTVLTWDGTSYVSKYSSNPIWIMYDIMSNNRYGLGEYITSDFLSLAYALEESKYAEGKVEDGNGGYEKRFRLDAVLDASTRALDVIVQMCAAFRGLPFYSNGKIYVKLDKPEYPVYNYGMGNIIENSTIDTWVKVSDIPNEIEIQFSNEKNGYQPESVFIQDKDWLNQPEATRDPRHPRVLRVLCTKLSYAIREGNFAMRSAKMLDRTLQFKASIDSIIVQAGDVINFSHDIPQIGESGRVKGGTLSSVTLDQVVVIEAGITYHIIVQFADDTQNEREVTNIPGSYSVLNVFTPFSQAPSDYDKYMFGKIDVLVAPYRITNMKRQANGEVELELLKYDEAVYDDTGLTLPTLTYTSLTSDVPVVTDVVLGEQLVIANDGTIKNQLDVWFALPSVVSQRFIRRYSHARIYVSTNSGTSWEYKGETWSNHLPITGGFTEGYTYTVAVCSVAVDGYSNPPGSSPQESITIVGKTLPPNDITGFEVSQIGSNLKFICDMPTDVDFAFIRIKKGNDWDTANMILERGDLNNVIIPVTEIGIQTYLCKAVDTTGNESENVVSDTINIRLLDTSNFIKDAYFMNFSDSFKLSNVDIIYRKDVSLPPVQKLYALNTSQTWEEYEALEEDWNDIELDFDTLDFESSGYIEMQTPIDLGVVARFYVLPDPNYTGTVNTTLTVQIATSEDDLTYTSFANLGTGVYRARYIKFKILLSTTDTSENIYLKNIYFIFESPDTKRVYGNDVGVSTEGTTILYGDTFEESPTINVTIVDGTIGLPIITEKGVNSFTVFIYNLSGTPIAGEIDWFAFGV